MRFNQWLNLIILVICLYIFWQIHTVLLLILTSVVFVVVLNRAVKFIQKRIPNRRIAVLALAISLFLIAGTFGAIIFPPFFNQLQELIALTPAIINQLQSWITEFGRVAPRFSTENFQGLSAILNQLQSVNFEVLFGHFFTWFSNTLTVTINIFLVTVLMIMILLNPRPYRRLFIQAFPSSRRRQVDHVLDNCENAIAGWSIGILFDMTIITLLSMIGLWILGVPLVLANGLLAGLLGFIPNLGPVLSVVPPVAIALLEAPWKAAAVLAYYIVIQQIEGNILTPLVMKRQVSLLPAVTLLSQVVFAVFFGFLGLLLALPLTLIIQQWLNEFWVKEFLEQH